MTIGEYGETHKGTHSSDILIRLSETKTVTVCQEFLLRVVTYNLLWLDVELFGKISNKVLRMVLHLKT